MVSNHARGRVIPADRLRYEKCFNRAMIKYLTMEMLKIIIKYCKLDQPKAFWIMFPYVIFGEICANGNSILAWL